MRRAVRFREPPYPLYSKSASIFDNKGLAALIFENKGLK
jgi:hypothetical protein